DDDMTARLRELLPRAEARPTDCVLAEAAAQMQMEHSVLLPTSREKLRCLLAELPAQGSPSGAQYRAILEIFFAPGETQATEDQLFHHREPMLRILSVALSARSLDDCGEPALLQYYLQSLLDNQRIMLEVALLKRLQGQTLPLDWFDRAPLLSRERERRLAALMPSRGMTRDKVKEHFWEVVNILAEAKNELPRYTPDPHLQARKEVLERATRAITSAGDVVPSAERIIFFTQPYAYECSTPRLGVVTRKPVSVCGSELRPEGMAAGGVMSISILLRKLTGQPQPLQGLTVTIEGLGNAGKHVATSAMQKGATIRGVSDSKGALICEGGFSREELAVIIAHKNSGRRLDTLLSSPAGRGFVDREGPPLTFVPEPAKLHEVTADILVLSAIPGTVHGGNAPELNVKVVCELTGAAVSGEAKRLLKDRGVHVIPDNLASSGGLLVSLYEMLQNSAGQNWDRALEESRLHQQLTRSFDTVLAAAEKFQVDNPTASDIVAVQRMHELAVFREQLEAAAKALAKRLLAIGPGEPVLVASDDDEDGVASAAILQTLLMAINPGAETRMEFLNESLRSNAVLDRARAIGSKHIIVLDRNIPMNGQGQTLLAGLAQQGAVTIVNNHWMHPGLLEPAGPDGLVPGEQPRGCAPLNILVISPQTLRSTGRAKEFSTALTLRELSRALIMDDPVLARIDWQAAVASCLDVPEEPSSEWVWFFTQFNPDRTLEAARAVRLVTRAGGFLNAVHALVGVTRPEQLETNDAWKQFMIEARLLHERIQVLEDKIVVENRSRPYTAHFFTPEEVASPTPVAGNSSNELDLYPWISEHLTRRGLGEKPIIVGQLVQEDGRACLGVRIRSPRGVDLMEAGLPAGFMTGGLPNTAIARVLLPPNASAEVEFQKLVDAIWQKTTNPIYHAASAGVQPG
ncbi:MAG TPA: hypothetical protein VN673_03620, partial [Clostridia bacterium]|nr:hypothetical protein [Clostridia bacterium]